MIPVEFPGLIFLFIFLSYNTFQKARTDNYIAKVTYSKVLSCFLMKTNKFECPFEKTELYLSILIERAKRARKKINPKDIQTGIS